MWGYPDTDDNYAYFVVDKKTQKAMAVDPAVHKPPVMEAWQRLEKQYSKLEMCGVLTTHKHKDHSKGNGAMKTAFPDAKIYGGKDDNDVAALGKENAFTDTLKEGDTIPLGDTQIEIFNVPCHTRGHLLYYVYNRIDKSNPSVFTGDTLFVGGTGHFFEGTSDEMLKNFQKIAKLPKHTKIYPGHEYAVSNFKFGLFVEPNNTKMLEKLKWCQAQKQNGGVCVPSTVEDEINTNVFMRTANLKEATKEKWTEAAKQVSLSETQKFNTEGDIMGALRLLKTSGYHNKRKSEL